MTTAPLIELRNVRKVYHRDSSEVPVLHGIDLSIQPGESVAIMGRSGSGKSTLLNVLGCLDTPSTGDYVFDGKVVAGLDDAALSRLRSATFGFVFQAFHLLRGMSIVENVELPMEYGAFEEHEYRPRALELLDLVGLSHRVNHRPTELSGGERQRVAIARALANRPRVLLADEPTGALDTKSQAAIVELFGKVRATLGTTLITVTHDAEVAAGLGDRLLRVADGRIA